MAVQYQYAYAVIDPSRGDICKAVLDTTDEYPSDEYPNHIDIGTYNGEYLFKYYNRENGKWYTDAAKTNEWTPA